MNTASSRRRVLPDEEDSFATLPGGIQLCYRSQGRDDAGAVILIAGLGLQLISWPEPFVAAIVAAGYRVITLDNRDAGRSSRMTARPPGKWAQLRARAPADNYSLEDMADDTLSLMDHLGLERAHLVGMSMGGMIAQALASRRPERVASLASIFSTTGHRRVGQPALSTLWRIARSSAPRSREEAVHRHAAMMAHIGDAAAVDIRREWREYAERAWERGGQRANASGIARQIGAIYKSGDRTERLRGIRAPTLVLHGDVDRMVAPSGGRATADAIPDARFVTVHGLRHQIDNAGSHRLAAHVIEHLQAAAAGAAPRTHGSPEAA